MECRTGNFISRYLRVKQQYLPDGLIIRALNESRISETIIYR